MHFDAEIRQLRAENDRLAAQIRDLEFLIEAREEELSLLRIKIDEVARLRSSLDSRLHEIEQLRQLLEEESRKLHGAGVQGEVLEKELLQSIKAETLNVELRQQSTALKTENDYLQRELQDSMLFYREVADLKKQISQLGSRLEMAALEKDPSTVRNTFPDPEEGNSPS